MIHQSYVDSARNIRQQYKKTQSELLAYQSDVEKLADEFTQSAAKVQSIGEDIKKDKLSVKEIEAGFMNILNALDDKYKILFEKIEKINSEIEFLKKQEIDLYEILKQRYPSLTDEELKKEIQSRL